MTRSFGLLAATASISAVLASAAPAAAARFNLVTASAGSVIVIRGDIERGDGDSLSTLLMIAKGAVIAVVLDSPGGSLLEATRLARIVREYKLKAAVPAGGECASGCILLYAAATTRYAGYDADIGVHSAAQSGLDTQGAKAATVEMARAASQYGVPDAIVVRMVETPPDRIAWLTASELRLWGVKVMPKDSNLMAMMVPTAALPQSTVAATVPAPLKRAPPVSKPLPSSPSQLPPAGTAAALAAPSTP